MADPKNRRDPSCKQTHADVTDKSADEVEDVFLRVMLEDQTAEVGGNRKLCARHRHHLTREPGHVEEEPTRQQQKQQQQQHIMLEVENPSLISRSVVNLKESLRENVSPLISSPIISPVPFTLTTNTHFNKHTCPVPTFTPSNFAFSLTKNPFLNASPTINNMEPNSNCYISHANVFQNDATFEVISESIIPPERNR